MRAERATNVKQTTQSCERENKKGERKARATTASEDETESATHMNKYDEKTDLTTRGRRENRRLRARGREGSARGRATKASEDERGVGTHTNRRDEEKGAGRRSR